MNANELDTNCVSVKKVRVCFGSKVTEMEIEPVMCTFFHGTKS